jgi:hypothetical protein
VQYFIVQTLGPFRKFTLAIFLVVLGVWLLSRNTHAAERKLDLTKAKARGIRVLEGKHLQLLTDVPSSPAIEELPTLFDAAVPHWAAFFGVPLEKTANWHVRGFLMQDRAAFTSAELLPADLPEFPNGYAYEGEFYLYNQSGDYYRRHLFLHEGTHLFHFNLAQIYSDQWYTEGIAEYLGLHEWKEGKLRLGLLPTAADQVPKWGRIEYLQQAIRRGETMNLAQLQNLQGPSFANTVSYSWTWAAIAVMEQHPQYRERARRLRVEASRANSDTPEANFRDVWNKLFAKDQADLRDDIAIFAHGAVYGYDWERNRVDFKAGKPFPADRREGRCAIDSARGWQSSGIQLAAGQLYEIRAAGKVLLQQKPEPWPAEPNGITLAYHAGQPLGILLGAIRDDIDESHVTTITPRPTDPSKPPLVESEARFMSPLVIGSGCRFRASRSGTLYLRLNDSPAQLQDNLGTVQVLISKQDN